MSAWEFYAKVAGRFLYGVTLGAVLGIVLQAMPGVS